MGNHLERIRGCANFDRHSRLSLEQANKRVKQETAVQQFDHRFAVQLKDNATNEPAEQSENVLHNNRTNACAPLSEKMADVILRGLVTGIDFFMELTKAIEDTIWHLPEKVNEH